MAFVYCGFLKEPTGLLKIFLLCLSIIDVCLARAGFHLVPYIETVDARWLAYVTCGAFVLILTVLVLSMIFSNEMSMSADILFSLAGTALYLATGSLAIEAYESKTDEQRHTQGMAFGSMCIITGIIYFIHLVLLFMKLRSNKSTI
eukprot:TRINITY_DN6484_c0_g1_i1.p1 TRINITY_DN6484_c0_g1~~TRINITY_DN6484_c0_g1_i1.p1  ORF type:complete len:146 (-),score=28.04 TRINITY_DN6484_c0_g1_i1:860-1297(-)